jgi:heme-degrading monooxygenase HmoA
MFARVTWSRISPQRIDEAVSICREKILPSLQTQPGFLGGVVLADRTSGEGVATSYWQTAETMATSEEMGAAGRAVAAQTAGAEVLEIDRFEVVLQDRTAPVQIGTFVRANDLRGVSKDQIDAIIALLRDEAIPLNRAQDGYRALLAMVNRETGRLLVASVWRSAAAREASDAPNRGLRVKVNEIAPGQISLYESFVAEVSEVAQVATTATPGGA